MNILYIDHYAGSLTMGMEFRPFYLAREWEKRGHKVRIVGADFSHLRKENPAVNVDFEIQNIDGLEYQWIKTGTYMGNGLKRAMTIFGFCIKLWMKAKKIATDFKPDVVISSSTYPLDTYPASRIAKCAGAVLVHEGHDLWPLTLTELAGMSNLNPFVIALSIAEKRAYRKSDHVVSVLPNTFEYMKDKGLSDPDKYTHIPNGIAMEDWTDNTEKHEILEQIKSQGKFMVMYLGGHAISNALDSFVEAARLLKNDERFVFVLIGKGTEKSRLQKTAEDNELKNIYFLPPVAKNTVPSVLDYTDALYIGAEPCTLYRYGVSMNKLYDYMMSAKPIINGVQAANNDVEQSGSGISIPPNDAGAIVAALEQLFEMDSAERQKMGKNGKQWVVENCDYSVLSEKFLQVIEKSKENRSNKQ